MAATPAGSVGYITSTAPPLSLSRSPQPATPYVLCGLGFRKFFLLKLCYSARVRRQPCPWWYVRVSSPTTHFPDGPHTHPLISTPRAPPSASHSHHSTPSFPRLPSSSIYSVLPRRARPQRRGPPLPHRLLMPYPACFPPFPPSPHAHRRLLIHVHARPLPRPPPFPTPTPLPFTTRRSARPRAPFRRLRRLCRSSPPRGLRPPPRMPHRQWP